MKTIRTTIIRNIKNLLLTIDYLLWAIIDPSKFTKIDKKNIKKVLIIHLGAIGELLMTTPLLRPLKKQLNCEICFMTNKDNEDILKENPFISKIFLYKSSFKENLEFCKKENFDLAVIIWPGSLKITLMCLFAGIKYRIGCFVGVKNSPQFFLTKRIFPVKKEHIVERYLDIIRLIGIDNKNPKINFYLSDIERITAKNFLKKRHIKDYLIIHPGFSFSKKYKYPSRLWPLERYSKVIDYFTKKYKIKVLLTGNDEERIFSEKIRFKVKDKENVIVTNGLLNYRQLAALVEKSKVVIGPGTSIIHLSTAFNTPIVELAGKERFYEWHPWTSKNNYKFLFHKEVCTECDRNFCSKKTMECMKSISVKEVINATEFFLNKSLKRKK